MICACTADDGKWDEDQNNYVNAWMEKTRDSYDDLVVLRRLRLKAGTYQDNAQQNPFLTRRDADEKDENEIIY